MQPADRTGGETGTALEDATPPPPGAARHTLGRMVCLTMLTPIRTSWLWLLVVGFRAGGWFKTFHDDVLQFNFIHYVRWAIVRDLPWHGPPQERDRLNYRYLLFESNFDGPWQHYIDAFAYCIPHRIRLLWGRGIAFPGPPPAEPLKRWIAMNSLEGGSYYCAYPEASTRMVKGALATREALRELVADSRDLGPTEFKVRYERFLADCQAHL